VNKQWGKPAGSAAKAILSPEARVWWNGNMVPNREVCFGVSTHSLHYGFGLFEGIRAYRQANGKSAVFRLHAHIDRLMGGAHILDIALPFGAEQLRSACIETMRANHLPEGYIRPLVTIGAGRMGIYAPDNEVHVTVSAWEWGTYLGEAALEKGVRARISSYTRTAVNTNMVRAKVTGQYVTSILAKHEAIGAGFDEGILLDKDGYCAEGTGENLFLVRNGTLVTPPLSSPILAGVTRDSVLQLAREMAIPVVEERCTRDELYIADEAFFTGTAAEITPIREVDGRRIGTVTPGPVTKKLQSEFFDILRGKSSRHPEWRSVYDL
jgi:branched-chain amino acid aminotransferase